MRPLLTTFAAALLFAFAPHHALSQAPAPAFAPLGSIATYPSWPAARPADVRSIQAIVDAVYDVISGPKGRVRDWDRMRSLFLPDARLIPIRHLPPGTHTDALPLTIDGYIARSNARMTTDGFFERGVSNRIEQYGSLVSVWSTYESRHDLADPKPFARGINSFQLMQDGERFWVVNILWDAEAPTTPIPAKYLP